VPQVRQEEVIGEPRLGLLRAGDGAPSSGCRVVLFVHGTTFPAALGSG
jgi:hypothetical protein